jgi:hypothetical protein
MEFLVIRLLAKNKFVECVATTLQHHLLIVVSCGFEPVKVESDCQIVVNVVTNSCVYKNE